MIEEHIYTESMNLENCIKEEIMPAMKGDLDMARQHIFVTLSNGEQVWITGETYSDLIQNAINKYSETAQKQTSVSFKEYTDKIFDVFLKPRWKPSTTETNKFLLNKHIFPYFQNLDLMSIDVGTIQSFFQTKQHLSKSYTKQMLIMLHEIFQNAMEDGQMKNDPTTSSRITLPQKSTKRKALEPEQYYDIISNLNKLSGDEALLIALLCFTGMRRGEILGLKWDCISEDFITVKAEVIYKSNQPIYNDYTKSSSGIRMIPISTELKPYLSNRSSGFVFGGSKPFTQCKFDRMWERIKMEVNLYRATPHVFRHTYLSMLAASNVDPKTIQVIAGHADFSFTFNKYIDGNKINVQNASNQFSKHISNLAQQFSKKG